MDSRRVGAGGTAGVSTVHGQPVLPVGGGGRSESAGDFISPPSRSRECAAPTNPPTSASRRSTRRWPHLRNCYQSRAVSLRTRSSPTKFPTATRGKQHRIASHRNPSGYGRTGAGEPQVTDVGGGNVVKVPERVSECVDRLADQLFTGGAAALDFGALICFVEQG